MLKTKHHYKHCSGNEKKNPEIVIYLLQKQLYLKVQDSEHPLRTTGKLK